MTDTTADQQRAYEVYGELCAQFHREPWNMQEALTLKGKVPDDTLILACLAWYGTSVVSWEFGHIAKMTDSLITVFGADLLPYLQYYIQHPVHGGGTAYGEAYLETARQRCKSFCEMVLKRLKNPPIEAIPLPFEGES